MKPSTCEPQGDLHIEWVYIVDLDASRFVVRSGSGWSREFKLENLPYHVFEQPTINKHELLFMPISIDHLNCTDYAPDYDKDHLTRFAEWAPSLSPITVAKESAFTPSDSLSSWESICYLLLDKFLDREIRFFKEFGSPASIAKLNSTGLKGDIGDSYRYLQLAWGLLNLCDSTRKIKFRKGHCVDLYRMSKNRGSYPRWQSSTKNILWMNSTLVIIKPRIAIQEFLEAAIGNAIDLVTRSRVSTCEFQAKAVIFSIQALVLVTITYPADIARDPEITYSQTLPVITPSDCNWYRCFGGIRATPPAGLAALVDVFTRQSESYELPAGLPVDIITEIYNLSDLATRKSLVVSCRAFRAIMTACPRIGDWELFHTWNHGNVGFVASRGPGVSKAVVSIEECEYGKKGYEVRHFRGNEMMDFKLPWFVVVKQQQEGYEGCACCAGLPVLSAAPTMVGRVIDMERYEAERTEYSAY